MDRRSFLKGTGAAIAGAAAIPLSALVARAQHPPFREEHGNRQRRAQRDRRRLQRIGMGRRVLQPGGKRLFANLQSPGITFAITGPWVSGAL